MERAALEEIPQRNLQLLNPDDGHQYAPPGAYPGARDSRDSFDGQHHVKITQGDIPGLVSPDDGGVRRYPSWDDIADDLGDAHLVDERHYAAETMAPHEMGRIGKKSPQRKARPGPGAFPGHMEHEGEMFKPRTKKSFAAGGVDPIDLEFDPRAAREAALVEQKRQAFKQQLDAQIEAKRAIDGHRDVGINRVSNVSREVPYAREPYPQREHSQASMHLLSPQREVMRGVPRRGVNPGNGEYSSPTARAGGGPSSFYLGGGDRGVAPIDGAFRNFGGDGGGAFVDTQTFNAAEARRLQLVADLDAQVRAKKEQKRLHELREELEDAKIERRIQEVIEQERMERMMKERMLERPGGDDGEYRVTNSPRAPVQDLQNFDDIPVGAGSRVESTDIPEQQQELPRSDTFVDTEIVHAEDGNVEDAGMGKHSEPEPVARVANSDDPDDDANALTPLRQLQRSPDVGARRPARTAVNSNPSMKAPRALDYSDVPGLEQHGVPFEFSTFNAPQVVAQEVSQTPMAGDGNVGIEKLNEQLYERPPSRARLPTPLDVKIAKLQFELENKDKLFEESLEEQKRLARERDLAERERDLEQQLHKIRTEIANGGVVGNAVIKVGVRGAVLMDSNLSNPNKTNLTRSFIGTGIDSFIVDSGFVRADAPLGPEHWRTEFNGLVPDGYTVMPDELGNVRRNARNSRREDPSGPGAPRVAGLQRRQARALAVERAKKASGDASKQHLAARAKENFETKPVWGATRGQGKPGGSGGNRWS